MFKSIFLFVDGLYRFMAPVRPAAGSGFRQWFNFRQVCSCAMFAFSSIVIQQSNFEKGKSNPVHIFSICGWIVSIYGTGSTGSRQWFPEGLLLCDVCIFQHSHPTEQI